MRHWKQVLLLVAALVAVPAMAAFAWPPPTVTGDCDGWSVTETATDRDWKGTAYWTIDGVDGQHERGATVFVADGSDAGEGTFMVRWFSEKGKELDAREGTGTRDLSGCEEPPPPVAPVVTVGLTCDAGVTFSWSEGSQNENRVLAVLGPDAFYAEQRMDQGTSLSVPFGGPYEVYILNRGGDEFVEFVLEDLWGTYEEPEECTPSTTVPPPPDTTTPPPDTTTPPPDTTTPAPPTTGGPAPTTPVQQGDSESGPQGSFPVPGYAIALLVVSAIGGGVKLAATRTKS